jgi:signal transduction histidine kinase
LDLPRAAQKYSNGTTRTRHFRVVGSRSGHIAGQVDLPLQGDGAEEFRSARLFNVPAGGQPMRWAALTRDVKSLGEEVTVVVGETIHKREHLADEILLAVWVSQLALLLLVAWVIYGIVSLQTERIRALSTALRDLSYKGLQPVSGQDMPQELQPLIEALNAMIGKLDHAVLAQRTFVANAAHQLRTPLTALKMQAEQAQRSGSLDAMREAVAGVQATADRALASPTSCCCCRARSRGAVRSNAERQTSAISLSRPPARGTDGDRP